MGDRVVLELVQDLELVKDLVEKVTPAYPLKIEAIASANIMCRRK
ncbi:MAG TPA: hypothetical protein VIH69_03275 [Dehalococcoidia bacterium]